MRSGSSLFIFKLGVFLIPAYAVILLYMIADPFKVIYHYNQFAFTGKVGVVALNRDYASVETFITNNPKLHYDAFIFGNSRSLFYKVSDWQKYIDSKRCFHFDASSESIYGIEKKIQFLKENDVKIKNAIMVLDDEVLSVTTNQKGVLFIKHPLLSGQTTIGFQLEFFKSFINYKFLTDYIYYLVTHRVKGFFGALSDQVVSYDQSTNEVALSKIDSMLKANPEEYYKSHDQYFFPRDSVVKIAPVVIKEEQRVMLQNIKKTLDADSTNLRIIISPLYDQVKFNPEDKIYLERIFGKSNVYDFSGINPITNCVHNYYENSHYRPNVASAILKAIYAKRNPGESDHVLDLDLGCEKYQ